MSTDEDVGKTLGTWLGKGTRSLTTHELFAYARNIDHDPLVDRAMLYMTGMTSSGDRTSLNSGVGSWGPASAPETASVYFAEPNSHDMRPRPLSEIVRQFWLDRWARRTERVLP